MDGFIVLANLAKAVCMAAETAQENKAQCFQLKERVMRIMNELEQLAPKNCQAFVSSPTGDGLTQALKAAGDVCEDLQKKSLMKRIFACTFHSKKIDDIQTRLDRVVADAALGATLSSIARKSAQEQDFGDARAAEVEPQQAAVDMPRRVYEVAYDELILETDGFRRNKERLGRGRCGDVYAGQFRDKPVAIKSVSINTPRGKDAFLDECSVVSVLGHPNICKFYGAAINPKGTEGRMAIELLHCDLGAAIHNPQSVDREPLDDDERLRITSQVGRGEIGGRSG
jgi:hypothetical protein